MLRKKRVTHTPSVLVARNAAEGVFLSIENKSVFGVNFEASAAKSMAYVVKNVLSLNYLYLTAIEVRILASVPEVDVFNSKGSLLFGSFYLLKFVFFLIVDSVNKLLTVRKVGCVNVNGYLCISAINYGKNAEFE